MNQLKVFEDNDLKIITDEKFLIIYNKHTEELTIQSNIKVNLDFCDSLNIHVNGDLDITTKGEINIVSDYDVAIDSKTLWLNSGMTKQMRIAEEEQRELEECQALQD